MIFITNGSHRGLVGALSGIHFWNRLMKLRDFGLVFYLFIFVTDSFVYSLLGNFSATCEIYRLSNNISWRGLSFTDVAPPRSYTTRGTDYDMGVFIWNLKFKISELSGIFPRIRVCVGDPGASFDVTKICHADTFRRACLFA